MREGWRLAKIGDVCKTATGGTPLKSEKNFYEGGTIPWLLSGEVGTRSVSSTKQRITEAGLKNSSAKVFPINTVLVAVYGATAGQVGVLRTEVATNQAVCGIYPNDTVYHEYLYYAFLHKQAELVATASGNAQPNISQAKIRETVPIPPLSEQKRIVAILDEAFTGIATAIANTEKNLANARELYASHLNSLLQSCAHISTTRKLEDVCKKITVGHVGSMAKRYKPDGIPLLRSQNIRPFRIDLEKVVYIDQEFHSELKKSALKPGDLGIVRTGYPGTAAVIPYSLPIANCSDLVIVRPGGQVLSDFLAVVFNSAFGKQAVAGVLVGSAQKHFNVTAAKAALVPIPSIEKQKRIVVESNEARSECEKLETIYDQKLRALANLKHSLLHKAFSGELTTGREAPIATLKEEEVA